MGLRARRSTYGARWNPPILVWYAGTEPGLSVRSARYQAALHPEEHECSAGPGEDEVAAPYSIVARPCRSVAGTRSSGYAEVMGSRGSLRWRPRRGRRTQVSRFHRSRTSARAQSAARRSRSRPALSGTIGSVRDVSRSPSKRAHQGRRAATSVPRREARTACARSPIIPF